MNKYAHSILGIIYVIMKLYMCLLAPGTLNTYASNYITSVPHMFTEH